MKLENLSWSRAGSEGDTAFLERTRDPEEPRFYIRYPVAEPGETNAPLASSLFDRANRAFEPEACQVLSSIIDSRLTKTLDWVRNHELLASRNIPEERIHQACTLISQNTVILHGLFALNTLVGGRNDLKAHNPDHTWEVLKHSILFALAEGHSARQVVLVAIAATFHDLGYLVRSSDNEPVGARLAISAMEDSNRYATPHGFQPYETQEIKTVRGAILDTYVARTAQGQLLHPNPRSELSKCLSDADMSSFGREDFLERSAEYFAELKRRAQVIPLAAAIDSDEGRKFAIDLVNFLSDYRYATESARILLAQKTEENRTMLLYWLLPAGI